MTAARSRRHRQTLGSECLRAERLGEALARIVVLCRLKERPELIEQVAHQALQADARRSGDEEETWHG